MRHNLKKRTNVKRCESGRRCTVCPRILRLCAPSSALAPRHTRMPTRRAAGTRSAGPLRRAHPTPTSSLASCVACTSLISSSAPARCSCTVGVAELFLSALSCCNPCTHTSQHPLLPPPHRPTPLAAHAPGPPAPRLGHRPFLPSHDCRVQL